MAPHLWTIVLAAGAGRRLAGVTGGVPKQFWRGTHRRSLLEDTLERFAPLAPPSRTVAVIDAAHRDYLFEGGVPDSLGTTVFQPEDRGTAAGVLLALMPVLDSGSDSVVAITPSDHGVLDDARFRHGVLEAARYARSRGAIVVFGVQPGVAHDDYGWITPGPCRSSGSLRAVTAFVEKPDAEEAARLLASGAVWNTMVLVARARAIQDLCADQLPELAEIFAIARRLPPSERDVFLAAVYPRLPKRDFSRDVLTSARNLSTYIWPTSVGWSDLGTPDRLHAWRSHPEMSRPPTGNMTAA
jgi:mannose-1-phosphate guanylyltransferase